MNVAAGAAAVCAGLALAVLVAGRTRRDPVTRTFPHLARAEPHWLRLAFERWEEWVGPDQLERDLWVLGRDRDAHRRAQATAAALGAVAAAVVLWASVPAWAVPVVLAGGGLAGMILWHRRVAGLARRRRAEFALQLTEVGELVALAVTAGRAPADAFAVAADTAAEPLRALLVAVADDVAEGGRLAVALDRAADRLRIDVFDRLAGTLVTASARGVPLAATLNAHVADVRATRLSDALRRAGRRESAMLVPIVALVLPCVVAVALLPGAMTVFGLD